MLYLPYISSTGWSPCCTLATLVKASSSFLQLEPVSTSSHLWNTAFKHFSCFPLSWDWKSAKMLLTASGFKLSSLAISSQFTACLVTTYLLRSLADGVLFSKHFENDDDVCYTFTSQIKEPSGLYSQYSPVDFARSQCYTSEMKLGLKLGTIAYCYPRYLTN